MEAIQLLVTAIIYGVAALAIGIMCVSILRMKGVM